MSEEPSARSLSALDSNWRCEESSVFSGANECKFWKDGNPVIVQEGESNPFPECGDFDTCGSETIDNGSFISGDGERFRYQCKSCAAGWRVTKIASDTVGGTQCPVTNWYPDGCYQNDDYSSSFPGTCPTSPHRTNECQYQSGQEWIKADAGQPLGVVGCLLYTLCTTNLSPDSALQLNGETPKDTYFAMCNTCKSGYHASKMNNSPSGTGGKCLANQMITECTQGPAPDNPTPA
eukprot:CAMPEP_0197552306 /NCGR_PEP_ID=MMETSP1320-20131121/5854_1 /TAXON_ID=91990 /ORGANISM="Bolidomonas sp., Strain RCC2347" /LENGTH=234 /DNA_ID=CAMNT_0043112885 /DNA_START=186 /DNA_END=886 /DNA_ORIENTATION=-